jgi:hypothetical protein
MLNRAFEFLRIKKDLVIQKGARLFTTLPNNTRQRAWVPNARTLSAATTLTQDDNGGVFFLSSATEFATTLPAPFLNARYVFIVAAAPSGASYTVVTSGSSNVMKGHVLTSEVTAAGAADSETSGGDTLSFVDGQAVVGDKAVLESDGTSWFVQASAKVAAGITITTAS